MLGTCVHLVQEVPERTGMYVLGVAQVEYEPWTATVSFIDTLVEHTFDVSASKALRCDMMKRALWVHMRAPNAGHAVRWGTGACAVPHSDSQPISNCTIFEHCKS